MSAALALGMQSCFNYKTYQDSFIGRVQSTELQGLKEAEYPIWVFGKGRSMASFLGFWAFGDWPPPGDCTLRGRWSGRCQASPAPTYTPDQVEGLNSNDAGSVWYSGTDGSFGMCQEDVRIYAIAFVTVRNASQTP